MTATGIISAAAGKPAAFPVRLLSVKLLAVPAAVILAGAAAACSSPPVRAPAYKACSALASWERSGTGTLQDGTEGETLSDDGASSPAFENALARWMGDIAPGSTASQYRVAADVAQVNGVCSAAGVKNPVP